MNICDLPSDQLAVIRDKIKTRVHGGLRLSSGDTAALVQRLNTVVAMVKEVEEESRCYLHALTARQDRLRNRRGDPNVTDGGKVVQFAPRPSPPSGNGGDAA